MGSEKVDYAAVLADLERRRDELDLAILTIKTIVGHGGSPLPTGGGSVGGPSAFLGMSIPDAAKKYLGAVREKKPTQEIIDALTAGGLPPSKYTTVYNILTRRQKQVGDIVNMKGDWALAEWYPNHRFSKSAKDDDEAISEEQKDSKKTATA